MFFFKFRSFLLQEKGSSTLKLNEALMYMIARDNMPLRTVEAPGFSKFIATAVPLYKVPSRRTLTTMLDDKYKKLSEKVCRIIHQAKFYSLTADAWTDCGNNRSYLGMTIHILDGIEMKNIALAAYPLEKPHTKEYLITEITNICHNWNINSDKVILNISEHNQVVKIIAFYYR